MKLLVTGGCGYKGSVLVPQLLADGHSVTSVDTQWFGDALPSHPRLKNLKLDIRDTDAIPLDGVDAVCTGKSTVGIEAVYWGKVSILLSDSFYENTGPTLMTAFSVDQLSLSIQQIPSFVVSPSSALPYGYYMETFGTSFQLFKPDDLFSGRLCGVDITATYITPWSVLYFKIFRTIRKFCKTIQMLLTMIQVQMDVGVNMMEILHI